MPVLTEGLNLGDVLKFEFPNLYSREKLTVLAGSGGERALTVGMVIGRTLTGGAAVAAALAGNTGNGAMGAITVGGAARLGVYRLIFVEPNTNAGSFIVEDPDGVVTGRGNVAAAFSAGGLSFTLADGATDFVSGDSFTITVTGVYKVKQIDFAATDGSAIAAGVTLANVTAPDGSDRTGAFVVRGAIVEETSLVWPAGANANQKAAAIAQLQASNPPILVRKGA